jgi:signal peptidase I
VIANRLAYRFTDPKRGQIVVFRSPEMAQRCGLGDGGSTFVKRIVGLPGEIVSERDGSIYISGDRLAEPYVDPSLRGHENGRWRAFLRATTSSSATTASTPATHAHGERCPDTG